MCEYSLMEQKDHYTLYLKLTSTKEKIYLLDVRKFKEE